MAMTSGIASPSACGQAMTSTVAVRTSAPSAVAEQPPDHERDDARRERDVEEERRRPIGQRLGARARRLRRRDEAHDPRQRRRVRRRRSTRDARLSRRPRPCPPRPGRPAPSGPAGTRR